MNRYAASVSELFLAISIHVFKVCDGGGYCAFPSFLWEPVTGGTGTGGGGGPRMWVSRTEYVGASDTWEKRKEIVVNETEMVVRHKIHASCTGRKERQGAMPCFRQDIVYQIICVSEQPDNKFRVQQTINEKQTFSCMKFVRRSLSVVQVFQAAPNDVNEHRLCYNAALQRDEWPWIDISSPALHFCSISGGFDFKGYIGETRQKMCGDDDWRSSRVESECVRGDGVTFSFPSTECNPFNNQTTDHRLHCIGEWTEENYVYFILTDKQKIPRFTLRLASAVQSTSVGGSPGGGSAGGGSGGGTGGGGGGGQFLGFFYFSGVAPLSSHGSPPGKVMFMEMHMHRSESGPCYDETDDCRKFAAEGRCYTNDATNQLANFCLRSCGMCELAASSRPECHFAKEYTGRWILFDSDGETKVDINPGEIRTSRMGNFICKSKHWQLPYYKVLSVSNNGCRPRYSCIHLSESGDILQYRLSQSSLKDESFSLCEFSDDPSPTGDKVRSSHMKTLFRLANLHFDSCGLQRQVRVNVTFSDLVSCAGTMSDADASTCSPQASLMLSLSNCVHGRTIDLSCVAHAQLSTGLRFLVTRRIDVNHILCWVVKPSAVQDQRGHHGHSDVIRGHDLWRQDLRFQRCRCSTAEEFQPLPAVEALASIATKEDTNRPCAGSLLPSPNRHLDAGGHDLSPSVPDERAVLADGQVNRNGSGYVQPIRSHPEYRRNNKDPAYRNGVASIPHRNSSNSHRLLLVSVSAFLKLSSDFGFL